MIDIEELNNQPWILEKRSFTIEEAEYWIKELGLLPIWHWEPEKHWQPPLNPEWRYFRRKFPNWDSLYKYWEEDFENTLNEIASASRYVAKLRRKTESKSHGNGLAARFDVFKRDGYRCRICGRSADDGIKLEIDHKIPRVKGGTDDLDNLWTLCFDCNRGKRTKSL